MNGREALHIENIAHFVSDSEEDIQIIITNVVIRVLKTVVSTG